MKNKNIFLIGIICLFTLSILVYFSYQSRIQKKEIKITGDISKQDIVTEVKTEVGSAIKKGAILQKTVPVTSKRNQENEIEGLIKDLGSSDWPAAQAAAEKLAKLGKFAVPKLIEAVEGASIGLKGQIIFLLGRIGAKEAVPILVEALKDDNTYIRGNAAEALGKIKDSEALPALATSLFDDDVTVRARSAMALGELNNSQAVEDLLNRMADEKDESVKSAVVETFGKIRDQRATQILLAELKSETDQIYKNKVVLSLGEIKDPQALEGLKDYLAILKQYAPKEPMVKFQWEQAIKIAEEAIQKIENKQ